MKNGITTVCLVLFANVPVFAQTGSLDPSFSDDGIAITDFNKTDDQAYAIAVQADGKIIAAGDTGDDGLLVCRYNSDGTLDTGFSGDGKFVTYLGRNLDIRAVSILSDGKIVIAGSVVDENYYRSVFVGRLNANGTWDTSFKDTGYQNYFISNNSDKALAMKVYPDGKILLAGQAYSAGITSFLVMKLKEDGNYDTSFSGDGITLTTNIGPGGTDNLTGMAVDTNGKIYLAGTAMQSDFKDFLAVVKINANGSRDNTFGTSSKAIIPAYNDRVKVAVQDDGKIILGSNIYQNQKSDFHLVRLNTNGTIDTTFGEKGFVIKNYGNVYNFFSDLTIQPDGKILMTGFLDMLVSPAEMLVARFNADGSTDESYGTGGSVQIKPAQTGLYPTSFAFQADGKPLVAGYALINEKYDFAVVRLKSDVATSVEDEGSERIEKFTLLQNYPNPFNPSTTISFLVARSGHITISAYDVLGRKVDVLVNSNMEAGKHSIEFNGSGRASGIYFVKMEAAGFSSIKKMIMVK
ncbi:MAG: T9SS type A sorting domain-containing protein [Bacteroidetes bacterium]|nr:T9SS type A sorting domain-containing protein [Bacteroidota bacterium]